MSQPLSVPSRLATQPNGPPQFSITLKNGKVVSDPRAQRAAVALMDMHAVLGGAASHFGGPAAFAEIVSAVHALFFEEADRRKKPWWELFNFVNDAGHCENGIYALRANYRMAGLDWAALKKFRSIESPLTGHGESHVFPEGVLLSNGPLGSAFPQSQGLAMADHLAGNSRVTVTLISDGACMEGEAREALASIPGFASRGLLAPFVLVISDNNTTLTGRIDEESFSMAPTFAALSALGWEVLDLENGNDLEQCYTLIAEALSKAQGQPRKPVAVRARTVKGIGTRKTATSASGGHGFPCKSATELEAFIAEIFEGTEVPGFFKDWTAELVAIEKKLKESAASLAAKPADDKIQAGISKAMIAAAKAGLPVVSLTSDLPGSTGVAGFRKEFPKLSFDLGVAEANMVSAAAGFSKAGYIPVVDTFAQFGVTKGALPLIMANLSQAPVIAVFSHTGFQDAADGASHQALSYLAMTQSIPHVRVVALSCRDEAEALMGQALQEFAQLRGAGRVPPSTIFFLGRENFPLNFGPEVRYQLDRPQFIRQVGTAESEKSVLLLGVGSMLHHAFNAQEPLLKEGVATTLIHPSTLVPFDGQMLAPALRACGGRVVIVEDHQSVGGFADRFARWALENKIPTQLKTLAVKGEFGRSAYVAEHLYQKHHIDTVSIVKAASAYFGA